MVAGEVAAGERASDSIDVDEAEHGGGERLHFGEFFLLLDEAERTAQ